MTVSHKRLGLLFILVGPTGAGKNTIMNAVLAQLSDLKQLPTATTRPIRPTEEEGREHHFVSHDEFLRMVDNDELLEWQNVHGRLYGVPRSTVEHMIANRLDRIADVDILGALRVRAAFPDNVVLIFVQPGASDDVIATIRERLENRGETQAEIENRLKRVAMEMGYAPFCDYLIINEDKEEAVSTLKSIIIAERSRRKLIDLTVRSNFPRHKLIYTAYSIILSNEKVLLREGKLPNQRILHGELPDEAAARAVRDLSENELQLSITPIHMSHEQRSDYEEIGFWYYHLPVELSGELPDDWEWVSVAETNVPESIQEKIRSMSF